MARHRQAGFSQPRGELGTKRQAGTRKAPAACFARPQLHVPRSARRSKRPQGSASSRRAAPSLPDPTQPNPHGAAGESGGARREQRISPGLRGRGSWLAEPALGTLRETGARSSAPQMGAPAGGRPAATAVLPHVASLQRHSGHCLVTQRGTKLLAEGWEGLCWQSPPPALPTPCW